MYRVFYTKSFKIYGKIEKFNNLQAGPAQCSIFWASLQVFALRFTLKFLRRFDSRFSLSPTNQFFPKPRKTSSRRRTQNFL